MPFRDVSALKSELSGTWLCSVVQGLTLYLDPPPTGAEMLQALAAYRRVCPPEKLALVSGTRSPGYAPWSDPIGQRILSEHATLMNKRRDHGVSVWDGQFGNTWCFTVSGVRNDPSSPSASYCQIFFPTDVPPGAIAQLSREVADALPLVSGHGGFTALFDPDRKLDAFNQIYAWAKNHPGLEVEDLNETLRYVLGAVKGANWLTLIGNALWRKLLGLPAFSPGVKVWTQARGVVLQAGDAPDLGRRNAGDTPALYIEVERALAPIKLKDHGAFAGRFAEDEATWAWLNRFLQPRGW
jgi:hypothetical protein